MKVHLFANYRLIAGKGMIEIDLPEGSTIRQVIDRVIEEFPSLKNSWFSPSGELYDHLNVFVNGVDAQTSPLYLDTPLKPEDNLEFLPPIAGG